VIKNLGGDWDVGRGVARALENAAIKYASDKDFSIRWGSGLSGGTTLILDLGWFKRAWAAFTENPSGYYQIGLNYINWVPEFTDLVGEAVNERWDRLGLPLAPPKPPPIGPARILVLGQVANDAQHGLNSAELEEWARQKVAEIRQNSEHTYAIEDWRPHPQNEDGPRPTTSLQDDLSKADLVVTYNSTAGLEALRQGIPVICSNNCVYHSLAGEECPSIKSRLVLFRRMAYAQWTLKEIINGDAIKFYHRFL
jgi:hypothetical protein